ncbi:hypothetical protein QUF72_01835 [Desulfobacterales bacterium HSG2]|nr:hypothetical protein [Desulfobacterales bacterium HSG2]
MCAPVVISNKNQSADALSPKKFIRRHDLPPVTRLHIACTALTAMPAGAWGTITALSKQFVISRTFVCILATTLKETGEAAFGHDPSEPAVIGRRLSYHHMLSPRLEGRCAIEAISAIMKRFDMPDASVGHVSQTLRRFGALLPDTLSADDGEVRLVIFLSDEIFSKRTPIPVTVDPVSSAILKVELADTRKAGDWKRHWECPERNGHFAIYLVSDEGRGLCAAQKEALTDIVRQPDTYHAVAHQLGKWVGILENAAYKAMEKEEDRYARLDSARSDAVMDRKIDEYEKAKEIADEKIETCENYHFLYLRITENLRIFDNDGNLRDRGEAEENIGVALNLPETLGIAKITKAVGRVRRTMPGCSAILRWQNRLWQV